MNAKRGRSEHEAAPFHLSNADEESTESLGYLGIQFIMCLAAIVGVWGILCLVSGLAGSEGFYTLCSNWIMAVSGN